MQICPGEPKHPDRNQVEEEMVTLFRQGGLRNHRSKKDMANLLEGEQAPNPNKNKGAIWPAYRGPASTDARNLGNADITAYESGKYSSWGHVNRNDMLIRGIPEQYADTYAAAFNGSKARNTWKQRGVILRTIGRCERDSGVILGLPWGARELQVFVGWCLEEQLSGSTINQYVSNVRTLHRDWQLKMDDTDWVFLSQVIKGHDNLRTPYPGRVTITPELLFEFKKRLSKSKMSVPNRRMIWVVVTALFQGCFRVGELVSPSKTQFCPDSTLRSQDVKITSCRVGGKEVSMLLVSLRRPKEARGKRQNVEVEIFDLGENCFYSCPRAWKKWRESSQLELVDSLPVFRWENGTLLTAQDLNKLLKEYLMDKVGNNGGYVATHSFRAGMVSVMGRLGYTDEEIKRQGRWASDCFLDYVKLGRAARLQEQWKLAESISGLITQSMVTGELRR